MTEGSEVLQISTAFCESLGQREPTVDQDLINFIKSEYPALYLHMSGSVVVFYQLLLANYPSDEQLQQLAKELPASVPVKVLQKYRSLFAGLV
jgi:hypothetical protein